MAELTVDMTYGKALFLAAQDVGKTDLIMEEATEIVELFQKEQSFFHFFCSPIISAKEKKLVIEKVFEGRASQELINLLMVLIDKGRGKHLQRIVQRYRLLMNESHGFSTGTIFSCIPLSPEQLASFEEKTGKLLGKNVKLFNKTDATIIGGVKILIEGKIIDASIKKRLYDLKDSIV